MDHQDHSLAVHLYAAMTEPAACCLSLRAEQLGKYLFYHCRVTVQNPNAAK